MVFDVKKEFKEFYAPKTSPVIVTVPSMNFVAVRGLGNPNDPAGEYQEALRLLYGISYTIKMSKKAKDPKDHIGGYFDYVVPPLEGLWWMEDGFQVMDYAHKERFQWISMIRLPDFVTPEVLARQMSAYSVKHPEADVQKAEFFTYDEGLVAQVMHKGPYDDEPATIERMDDYASQEGYVQDFTDTRHHHEIYLSDPRRVKPESVKTIIRHPVCKK